MTQTNHQHADEMFEKFLARREQGKIATLIKDTYGLLLDVAERLEVKPAEDLHAALGHADSNTKNDLNKACQLFISTPIGISERLSTVDVINRVRAVPDVKLGAVEMTEQAKNELVHMLFEFRACCLALREHRNFLAHGDSAVTGSQAIFCGSGIVRSFELSSSIHQALKMDFKHSANQQGYEALLRDFWSHGYYVHQGSPLPRETGVGNRQTTTRSVQPGETRYQANENSQDAPPARQGLGEKGTLPSLSVAEAETALIQLRDRIYNEMQAAAGQEFMHYHNLLQRPLIVASLMKRCTGLQAFRDLKEYKKRITNEQRYPPDLEELQLDQYGAEIDALLHRVDYAKPFDTAPEDADDDLPRV